MDCVQTVLGNTVCPFGNIKSVLGRVRNNIHKVLFHVAYELRHTLL